MNEPSHPKPPIVLVAAALLALLSAGCSDSEDGTDEPPPTSESPVDDTTMPPVTEAPGSETPPAAEGTDPDDDSLYALSVELFNPDGALSYSAVVDSLGEDGEIDLGNSLETPGTSRTTGLDGSGVAYVSTGESPELTEYTFDEDGTPTAGRTLSFANFGLERVEIPAYISPTKSYVRGPVGEIIVWNPSTMEITTTIDTELPLDPGFERRRFSYPLFVGDRILWVSSQEREELFREPISTVTVIDTTTDTLVSNTVEDRCYGMVQHATVENGGP